MTTIKRILLGLGLVLCVDACGGDKAGIIPDLGKGNDLRAELPADMEPGPDGGGAPCVTNDDCSGAGLVCAYPIADGCSAVGHCAPVPTPTCASILLLCGCSGQSVEGGGCFYQTGYAGGPTLGGSAPCSDGGSE